MEFDFRPQRSHFPVCSDVLKTILALGMFIATVEILTSHVQAEETNRSEAKLIKLGAIKHAPVKEASGMVRSRKHRDVFWVVSDSGSKPSLFAVNRNGKLICEYPIETAGNVDWEALAADKKGHLYIGDVGNNIRLPIRWVYVIAEPNPLAKDGQVAQPIKPLRTCYFTYPKDKSVDFEAMFYWRDALYLVGKSRDEGTTLFRLDPAKSKSQVLSEVAEIPDVAMITGAAVDEVGKRLVLHSYERIWFFELRDRHSKASDKASPIVASRGNVLFTAPAIESAAWDADQLLLLSENRQIFAIKKPIGRISE